MLLTGVRLVSELVDKPLLALGAPTWDYLYQPRLLVAPTSLHRRRRQQAVPIRLQLAQWCLGLGWLMKMIPILCPIGAAPWSGATH